MSKNRNIIVIVGTRRSGTTFLGKLLSEAGNSFSYIEEPLNPVRGIKSLNHVWYPYISLNTKKPLQNELKNLLNLNRVRFKNSIINVNENISKINVSRYEVFLDIFKNESNETILRRILRFLVKSNHNVSYYRAKFLDKKNIIFKDALMSLSVKLLNKNASIVFIYRNPFAFYNSIKKQKWTLSTSNFTNQKALIEDYPFIEELNSDHSMDHIINEWVIINKVILEQLKKGENITCISHDKLSENPISVVRTVFSELEINDKLDEEAIQNLTNGSYTSHKTKDVRRNSKEVLNSWKGKLTKIELDYIKLRTESIYKELDSFSI